MTIDRNTYHNPQLTWGQKMHNQRAERFNRDQLMNSARANLNEPNSNSSTSSRTTHTANSVACLCFISSVAFFMSTAGVAVSFYDRCYKSHKDSSDETFDCDPFWPKACPYIMVISGIATIVMCCCFKLKSKIPEKDDKPNSTTSLV